MATTRRAQILMEPEEYQRLEEIARGHGVSVAELIRGAVRERYLGGAGNRKQAAELICAADLEIEEWDVVDAEIEEAHDAALR